MLYPPQKTTLQDNAFKPELLRLTGDMTKYEKLVVLEPGINWLGYCAKLYKKSHAINSVATRIRGAWVFREFLQTLSRYASTTAGDYANIQQLGSLSKALADVETAANGAKYRIFDDFSTWCDSVHGYAPNVTWSHVQSAKTLADYCDCGLVDDDFAKHVTMPTATQLNEEYPPNDKIQAIVDVSSPSLRAFILTMCDAGLEPVDATKLQKSMIHFDEMPVRLEFKRKKTAKPITAFLSDHTAQLLKTICADKADDDFVFTDKLTVYRVANMRQMYNRSVKRAGLNETIPGHKYGKYHMKIYKKRWFTMAISAGIPEYVAQGMLGRKKYLDQYMALPLDQKREFAKKILRKVSIYASEQDKQEVMQQASQILGIAVDEKTITALKTIVANWREFSEADKSRLLDSQ